MSQRLRCPTCLEVMAGTDLNAHLVKEPAHRAASVAAFAADHPDQRAGQAPCEGGTKIVPTWDHDERVRFGAGEPCVEPIMTCTCGYTMCGDHCIACARCGRFACLRHRHSGQCPRCSPERRRKRVSVPRHDPFTKRTTLVHRSYTTEGPDVWERARAPADG